MTTMCDISGEDNISRLNAFLDRFPAGCDPDFDAGYDDLDRDFSQLRDLNDGGAYA